MHLPTTFALVAALSATLAAAKTDLDGCTRTDISSPAGASYAWIVPGTGELCDPLDCGGGQAPPKTTVPGCAAYVGTATYSPTYLAGFAAPAVTAAPAAATTTAVVMPAASASASAAVTTTAPADASDDGGDDGGDDYTDPLSLADIGDDQKSTYVWRTADNPTATFNPFTVSAFPSDISTFWIPIDLGSTTSWEPAVPTVLANGYTDIVPAGLPASSDLAAICAIATNSGCGINTATMTMSRSGDATTSTMTTTSSITKSWVMTIATFTMTDTDSLKIRSSKSGGQSSSGSASRSTSESAQTSTGAAQRLGCVFGGGVVAAVGALAVM
jgi:hypothetical protein